MPAAVSDPYGLAGGPAPQPIEIAKSNDPAGIRLHWSDGKEQFIPALLLRRQCPCASCVENRGESSHDRPLSPAKRPKLFSVMQAGIEEQTEIVRIWPVGNYALGVSWGDKHDSGIYEYGLLRALGDAACTQTQSS
jgi:ATP-binding protein involved in chromosome partitioning